MLLLSTRRALRRDISTLREQRSCAPPNDVAWRDGEFGTAAPKVTLQAAVRSRNAARHEGREGLMRYGYFFRASFLKTFALADGFVVCV